MIIEKHILPCKNVPIQNKFQINKCNEAENYHVVIYYIKDNICDIIIRRIDSINGWTNELTITLYSIDQTLSSILVIKPSEDNYKRVQLDTNITLIPVNMNYAQKIPKTIVQTDESNDIGLLKYNSVMSLIELNPEYEYIFFDRIARRKFIKQHFTNEILEAYDILVPGAYRADLFRYCYLYLNGGCYFDCKMILIQPLRELILESESLILLNDHVSNAFTNCMIMTEKHDSRLLECIMKIVQNVNKKIYDIDNLSITGSRLLYSFYNKYTPRYTLKRLNNDLYDNYSNSIMVDNKNKLLGYLYYPGYYQEKNYKNIGHYTALYNKKKLYYINKRICDNYIVYVFPTPWNDTFDFKISYNQLIVNRTDKNERWGQYLIIKLIDTETDDDITYDIGSSNGPIKIFKFKPDIYNFFCADYDPKIKSTLNFGDCINKVFFDLLTGQKMNYNRNHNTPYYHCTGSIFRVVNEHSIVYGTGFMSAFDDVGAPPNSHFLNKVYKVPKHIISVRGPLTRKKLLDMGVSCPENYGDPLILFPLIYNNNKITVIKGKIGIIPHYSDQDNSNMNILVSNLQKTNPVEMINVCTGYEYKPFIDAIQSCEYIISSSLHGMMMGLVYKKKTVLIEFSNKVVGHLFKFNDFFASINVKYQVKNIYDKTLLDNCISYDLTKIKQVAENMIMIAPFIQNKQELIEKCQYFISS